MDRGNHANRIEDDQRKHETEGLVDGAPVMERDDRHLQEAVSVEGGLVMGAHRPLTSEPVGDAPSVDATNKLADFARWFTPSHFPTNAGALADSARSEFAPAWVVTAVEELDPDRTFDTVGELWEATGLPVNNNTGENSWLE